MGFLKSQQLHVGGGVEVKLAIKTDVITPTWVRATDH